MQSRGHNGAGGARGVDSVRAVRLNRDGLPRLTAMKDKALALLMKLFGAKLIRQGLAAAGGFFTAQGMVVDAHSTASIIGGVIAYLIATAWSYFSKSKVDAETADKISLLAQALASQVIAFLAGWLQQLGYTGSIDDSAGATLFLANYGLSQLSRPDPVKPKPALTGRPASQRPPGL